MTAAFACCLRKTERSICPIRRINFPLFYKPDLFNGPPDHAPDLFVFASFAWWPCKHFILSGTSPSRSRVQEER